MEKPLKFKFKFITITEDTTFTDQNVWSWEFRNIGKADAKINNDFLLAKGSDPNNSYKENLNAGEKTAQGYKVIFDQLSIPADRSVLVIQKILITD